MIIQCQGCAAKYFLPADKVPHNPLKVRCPKCKSVFTLAPLPEPITVAAAAAPARVSETPQPAQAAPPIESTVPTPVVEPAPVAATQAPTVAEQATETPAPGRSRFKGGRSKEDRAKRLARVLVSDILWYNRDKRDQALEEGILMTALGEEIKKSWELYKDKVGADVAGSTNYFKEALNEILADGQEVF
jgi:predicted Zn finger-like uncharacterized protein